MRKLTPVALAAALTACASSAPAPHAHLPRAAPVMAVRPAPSAPWIPMVVPALDAPVRVADDPDGTLNAYAGALRFTVRGDRVELARDYPAAAISYVPVRHGEHWYFLTNDGAYFRAASFTGPLTRLADTGGVRVASGYDSAQVALGLTDDARLWIGGPGESLRRAPSPVGERVVDAGFVDAEFGLVSVAPGRLFRTVDGGGHFEPLDVSGLAAFVIYPDAGMFVVQTTAGRYRVDRVGAPAPYAGALHVPDHSLPRAAYAALEDALAHDAALGYLSALADHPATTEGAVVDVEGDELVMHGPQGVLSRTPLPGSGCRVVPWGARVLAHCEASDERPNALYVSQSSGGWAHLRDVAGYLDFLASPEGTSVVLRQPCGEDAGARDARASAVCWFDGGAWHNVVLPAGLEPVALWGDSLLARDDESSRAAYVVVRREGEPRDVVIRPSGMEIESATLVEGGAVSVVGVDRGARFAAVGAPERPLTLRAVPVGASGVAFVDAARGIAAGADLEHVWTTPDGGSSWAPLGGLIDGDGAAVPLVRDGDTRTDVECGPTRCMVGTRLAWVAPLGGVREAIAAPRLIAATRAPPIGSTRSARSNDRAREIGWTCVRARSAAPAPPVAAGTRLYASDGWIEPHRASSEGVAGRFAFIWGGTDDRGRFRAQARPGALADIAPPVVAVGALPSAAPSTPGAPGLVPRLVTRTMAILERCRDLHDEGSHCDIVIAPRGEPPRVFGINSGLLALERGAPSVRGALALPDGGAALHLASRLPFEGPSERVDVVIRLDARGNVSARRAFAWPPDVVSRALARSPAGAGIAVMRAHTPRSVTFFSLDPTDVAGTALGEMPDLRIEPCGGPPEGDPGATVYIPMDSGFGPTLRVGQESLSSRGYARAIVETSASARACLRGFAFWHDPRNYDDAVIMSAIGGAVRVRASGGVLAGSASDGLRDAPLSCVADD